MVGGEAPVITGQEPFMPVASQTVLAVPSLSTTGGQEDWRVQLQGREGRREGGIEEKTTINMYMYMYNTYTSTCR